MKYTEEEQYDNKNKKWIISSTIMSRVEKTEKDIFQLTQQFNKMQDTLTRIENVLTELEQNQQKSNNQENKENQYYKQGQQGQEDEDDSQKSFYFKVRNYPYKFYDESTDTLGIRVPRSVKNEFLLLCQENNIKSGWVITYVLENFFKK